jgi:hypothetical protein
MAANSSLGAALGGVGDAERLPGRPLPALVLDRLGYPVGAGAPRLVSAAWRREADRLFGREREIQLALEGPHDELLALFLNRAVGAKDVEGPRSCPAKSRPSSSATSRPSAREVSMLFLAIDARVLVIQQEMAFIFCFCAGQIVQHGRPGRARKKT